MKASREFFDQAIANFNKAVQIDPDFAGAWHLLSVTYQNLGDVAAQEHAERMSKEAQARKDRLNAKS